MVILCIWLVTFKTKMQVSIEKVQQHALTLNNVAKWIVVGLDDIELLWFFCLFVRIYDWQLQSEGMVQSRENIMFYRNKYWNNTQKGVKCSIYILKRPMTDDSYLDFKVPCMQLFKMKSSINETVPARGSGLLHFFWSFDGMY